MMTRNKGGIEWSKRHNCVFAMDKFALVGFTRKRENVGGKMMPIRRPAITLEGQEIKPVGHHKFLGVLLDQELSFDIQAEEAYKKGHAWITQYGRLAKMADGVNAKNMRRFYLSIALPKILYASELYLFPDKQGRNSSRKHIQKLTWIHRMAAIKMTRALRTTATNVAEIHANIMPLAKLISQRNQRAALRIATKKEQDPIHKLLKEVARRGRKKNKTPIHEMVKAYGIGPKVVEEINVSIHSPKWLPTHKISIADREMALKEATEEDSGVVIFSDGSGFGGKIGAAAILYEDREKQLWRRKGLGTEKDHTVYEGELVGIILGLDLAYQTNRRRVTIWLDNQVAIRASAKQESRPGQYLIKIIHHWIRSLEKKGKTITLKWVPGHQGNAGNEEADKEAKEAAKENDHGVDHLDFLKNLPISKSAAIQEHSRKLKEAVKEEWRASPRFERMKAIDESFPSPAFARIMEGQPKWNTAALIQLRTGHIPLNKYLHKIGKRTSAICERCSQGEETVKHYLLECTAYSTERAIMKRKFGRSAESLKFLLSNQKALGGTIGYINQTKRMIDTHGVLNEGKAKEAMKAKKKRKEGRRGGR